MQALVLLNDPQFVEASRAFAERILRQGPRLGPHGSPRNIKAKIRFAFELATARMPTQQEVGILVQAYQQNFKQYQTQPERALAILQVGESERDTDLDLAEHAAWTGVAKLILNLSETITNG